MTTPYFGCYYGNPTPPMPNPFCGGGYGARVPPLPMNPYSAAAAAAVAGPNPSSPFENPALSYSYEGRTATAALAAASTPIVETRSSPPPNPAAAPFTPKSVQAQAKPQPQASAATAVETASEDMPAAAENSCLEILHELFLPREDAVPIIHPEMKMLGRLWISLQFVIPTNGLQRYWSQHPHAPSLCLLYQFGKCNSGASCNQIHVNKKFAIALRQALAFTESRNCCVHHGDLASHYNSMFPSSQIETIALQREGQSDVHIPISRVAYTLFWHRFLKQQRPALFFTLSRVCALHQRNACKFGVECKNVHLCREVYSELMEDGGSGENSALIQSFIDDHENKHKERSAAAPAVPSSAACEGQASPGASSQAASSVMDTPASAAATATPAGAGDVGTLKTPDATATPSVGGVGVGGIRYRRSLRGVDSDSDFSAYGGVDYAVSVADSSDSPRIEALFPNSTPILSQRGSNNVSASNTPRVALPIFNPTTGQEVSVRKVNTSSGMSGNTSSSGDESPIPAAESPTNAINNSKRVPIIDPTTNTEVGAAAAAAAAAASANGGCAFPFYQPPPLGVPPPAFEDGTQSYWWGLSHAFTGLTATEPTEKPLSSDQPAVGTSSSTNSSITSNSGGGSSVVVPWLVKGGAGASNVAKKWDSIATLRNCTVSPTNTTAAAESPSGTAATGASEGTSLKVPWGGVGTAKSSCSSPPTSPLSSDSLDSLGGSSTSTTTATTTSTKSLYPKYESPREGLASGGAATALRRERFTGLSGVGIVKCPGPDGTKGFSGLGRGRGLAAK